jgi:hypothetical protein
MFLKALAGRLPPIACISVRSNTITLASACVDSQYARAVIESQFPLHQLSQYA